jgi:hypothetical protein
MTAAELIERLEDMNPDAEVRLAFQPSYPLAFNTADVVAGAGECPDCDGEGEVPCPDCERVTDPAHNCKRCGDDEMIECERCTDIRNGDDDAAAGIVYIAAGNHPDDSPYLPGDAARALGWR